MSIENIEKLVPNYKHSAKNQSISDLVLFYYHTYINFSEEPMENLISSLRYHGEEARKYFTTDPELCLEHFDNIKIIGYILMNRPIESFEIIIMNLEHKLKTSTEKDFLEKGIIEMGLLKKHIKRAKEYQKIE